MHSLYHKKKKEELTSKWWRARMASSYIILLKLHRVKVWVFWTKHPFSLSQTTVKAQWSSSVSRRQKPNHGWQLQIKNSNVSTWSFILTKSTFHGLTWSEEAVCFSLVKQLLLPEKFSPHCFPNKWSIRESTIFGFLSALFICLVDSFSRGLVIQFRWFEAASLFRFQCSLFLHCSFPLLPSFISSLIRCSCCLQSKTLSIPLLAASSSAPLFPLPDFVFSLQHDKPLVS